MVEDNANDLELMLRVLKKNNIANHVEIARDGAEALEFLFAADPYPATGYHDTPRLILLDLTLPKVDGLQVLERIKSDPRTRTIPVVILTASHEERVILDSYELGVNSYIVKPVDFAQFTNVVEQLGLYWLLINQPPSA